jgi:hypothetical protein
MMNFTRRNTTCHTAKAPWRRFPMRIPTAALAALAALAAMGCEPEPDPGLYPAVLPGQVVGPAVVFDPLRQPDPEIPFPNDSAIRIDENGFSRLNVSEEAHTQYERRFRDHLNEIPGFSGITPITVSFDGPLDLRTLTDDTVFVVNVQEGSKRFGERLPIDLGRGWFPPDINPTSYVPHDPYAAHTNMTLPPDNLADMDGDGTPETPVYHYEMSTNTLDIRPLVPLEAGAQYAVVLTRGIEGWNKDGVKGSIRSPFATVNHDGQTAALRRALPSLAEAGVEVEDIAFAWTLTTGDLAKTFRTLREGLYGRGPFAWLNERFPAAISQVYDLGITHDGDDSHPNPQYQFERVERDHRFVLQSDFLNAVLVLIQAWQPGVGVSFGNVDYVVFGEMITPNFRATEDEVWDVDIDRGTATVEPEKVPWMLTVPRSTTNHKPPFPVVVHAHATATSRIESLLIADKMAQAGIAVFTIDAVGHGPILTDPKKLLLDALGGGGEIEAAEALVVTLVQSLIAPLLFTDAEERLPAGISLNDALDVMLENGFMQQLALLGRAVDDNGDCEKKAAEGYYTPDAFRLRDAMRQTTFDYIVAVRMLRALDPQNVPPAIADPRNASDEELRPNLLAGDFNADGVLDVGGPNVPYFMSGVSLGGIHTALVTPLEEYIVAAAPVVAGAGLADIFIRTKLREYVTPIMHLASGPVVVGCPQPDGTVAVSFNNDSDNCQITERSSWKGDDGACLDRPEIQSIVHASLPQVPGARIRVTHLPSGTMHEETALPTGAFAVPIESDKGDPLLIEVLWATGSPVATAEVVSPYEGVGKQRNTPDFRRLVQRVANVLEGSDAITVADRMFRDPLPGSVPKNVLLMLASGDRTVNFASGVALARAIGLFGEGDPAAPNASYRAWTETAIAARGLVDSEVPPPVLDPSNPEGGPGLCQTVRSGESEKGISALCIADVKGHHEYIAQAKDTDGFPALEGYDGTYTEYHLNMMINFFHSLGTVVTQDPCWSDWKCVKDRSLDAAWDAPLGPR